MTENYQRAEVLVCALPYIKQYSGKIVVVKYGGNAMINDDLKKAVMGDVALLSLIGVRVVLVHGGGPELTETMTRMNLPTRFVNGLRVTDRETAQVALMVLAGKINKNLVNLLHGEGGRAIGLSGIDGHMIRARMLDESLGYVGEITAVNPDPILDVLDKGYIPVVSTVGCDDEVHLQHQRRHRRRAHRGRARRRKPDHDDRHQRHPARLRGRKLAHPHGARVGNPRAVQGRRHHRRDDPEGRVLRRGRAPRRAEGVHHRRARAPLHHRRDADRRGLGHYVHQIKGGTPHLNTFEKDSAYIAHAYGRLPLEFARASGSEVFGSDGKRYIDLGSGIAVNAFGHCDPVWTAAVEKQLGAFAHTSNYYYSAPQAELAERLCARTGLSRVFFSNSGAEANECAIKTARKYSFDKYGPNRGTVVTLTGSFHGRTMATLAATGQDAFHHSFFPFPTGFAYTSPEDAGALEKALDGSVCALLLELVQGEGGVNVLSRDFVQTAAALCAERDILLLIDEVQTGNGRSGTLYAFEQYGVVPDIVTTAKGLGGGLPIGATLLGAKTADTLTPSSHGSTFGGNPVCAAGAVSILDRIDDALLAGVRRKSAYIRETLGKHPAVEAVDGLGLMLGVKTTHDAKAVCARALEKGLLVLTAKDKVRLLPALNIPDALLAEGLDILQSILDE